MLGRLQGFSRHVRGLEIGQGKLKGGRADFLEGFGALTLQKRAFLKEEEGEVRGSTT